jgi:hypothetical protein
VRPTVSKSVARKNSVHRTHGTRIPRVSLVVGICVMIIIVASYFFYYSQDTTIRIDYRLKMHFVDWRTNTNYSLPMGIGTTGGLWTNHTLDGYGEKGYSPMSTRDSTSTIFLRSTVYEIYTFADFFNVWGQVFTRYCAPLPPNFSPDSPYCAGAAEIVVYDSNNNNQYDAGEPVVSNTTAPPNGTPLASDPKLEYVDSNGIGHWVKGDPVVYDVLGTYVYSIQDPVVNGTKPKDGTHLRSDPLIRYIDLDGNGHWDDARLPPVLSDGSSERCASETLVLSNNKDWLIILYPDPGLVSGNCVP